MPTTSQITLANRWDHILARWAVNRNGHRVDPGLYTLGNPDPDSPVFVTGNYTLSFDALRSQLEGIDSYILVLDTKGINVWCAAGKGTFGTEELIHRVDTTQLKDIVNHRELILPQLGAPGIAAHEVRKRSKFKVVYGPVRSADLPEYLHLGKATPAMRRVRFTFWDRITLIPVELIFVLLPLLIVGFGLRHFGAVAAILAGVILFPLLMPWIPTPNFSTKGYFLGGLIAIPFIVTAFRDNLDEVLWLRIAWALTFAFIMPPITAYLSLNFTGSTTSTSRTGVRREILTFAPSMVWLFGLGVILNITLVIIRVWGG